MDRISPVDADMAVTAARQPHGRISKAPGVNEPLLVGESEDRLQPYACNLGLERRTCHLAKVDVLRQENAALPCDVGGLENIGAERIRKRELARSAYPAQQRARSRSFARSS